MPSSFRSSSRLPTRTYVLRCHLSETRLNILRSLPQGVKAIISIGGWGGSVYFSSNVATAENRTAFVKTITDFTTQWKVDGIDFDWEYPGTQGIGCNVESPQDTDNFLAFLQALRQDSVGKNLILSASTTVFPWNGAAGTALTDVSGFAQTLDFISIMNYELWGSW